MTSDTRMTMHRGAAALVAIALLAAGAGATYLLMRGDAGTADTLQTCRHPRRAAVSGCVRWREQRAAIRRRRSTQSGCGGTRGIVVAPVASGTSGTEIRLPGVVEPNAYRQVVVTPLVAGRVTKVGPALGDRVRRGQTLAEIYSPALAGHRRGTSRHRRCSTRMTASCSGPRSSSRSGPRADRSWRRFTPSTRRRQRLSRVRARSSNLLGVSASALENMASGHNVSATTNVLRRLTAS